MFASKLITLKLKLIIITFSLSEEEFGIMQQEQGLMVEYMQSVRILETMINNVS